MDEMGQDLYTTRLDGMTMMGLSSSLRVFGLGQGTRHGIGRPKGLALFA